MNGCASRPPKPGGGLPKINGLSSGNSGRSSGDRESKFVNKLAAKSDKIPMNTTFTVAKGAAPLAELTGRKSSLPEAAGTSRSFSGPGRGDGNVDPPWEVRQPKRSESLNMILQKTNSCFQDSAYDTDEATDTRSLPRELAQFSNSRRTSRGGKGKKETERPWSDKLPRIGQRQMSGSSHVSMEQSYSQAHFDLQKYKRNLANY